MTGNALVVFARVPIAGQVKTRLLPVLSARDAARLHEAFLQDAVEAYSGLDASVRLYLAVEENNPIPTGLVPDGVHLARQVGESLGSRMLNALTRTFADGFQRVVIIGTDHPTLPVEFVEEAFACLRETLSIVLGPAEDGGFYLVGMNDLYPELFEDMQYSHSKVFVETLDRAARTAASLTILPPWYDVDTPESLTRLMDDLACSEVAAPRTRQVLESVVRRR